jgi:hypothetical protein
VGYKAKTISRQIEFDIANEEEVPFPMIGPRSRRTSVDPNPPRFLALVRSLELDCLSSDTLTAQARNSSH